MQTFTILRRFNVQWVVVGYCYFIWLHLLPSVLYINFLPRVTPTLSMMILLWLTAGIVLLSGYIGFRSRGFTIVEPAVSTVLYVWTLFLVFAKFSSYTLMSRIVLMVLSASIIAFAIAFVSAWIGEYFQALGMRKAVNEK